MAIYDFSKVEKTDFDATEHLKNNFQEKGSFFQSEGETDPELEANPRGRFFSSLAARLLFLLLWGADLLWIGYCLIKLFVALIGWGISLGKMPSFISLRDKAIVSLRRSLVCCVSLFIAIFSPAFGIMIACTYFLMYDKSGIEEVVPSSLRSQFKEFYPPDGKSDLN